MRTNGLFLTAAAASLMMFTACAHDDDSSTVTTTPTIASNEIVVSTRHSGMAITRAESSIQEEQFDASEYIDVFLQDNDYTTTGTLYDNPIRYKTNGSGGLKTYTYTTDGGGTRTYDSEDDDHINRLFWPKLMHDLNIFGVYPEGSVKGSPTQITAGDFAPFTQNNEYYFTVQTDQTTEANYKLSDLMTGRPLTYTAANFTAPYLLNQVENPGNIVLTFVHRLTKIIVNVTLTKDTDEEDVDIEKIKYDSSSDKQYALVTLLNTKQKTTFKVNTSDELGTAIFLNTNNNDTDNTIIVGKGDNVVRLEINTQRTTINDGVTSISYSDLPYDAVSLSAIVPPQTISQNTNFIKVDLIDETLGAGHITDTFYYAPTTADLNLAAKNVYTFNIRINKPHIDVTTTITPWTSNASTNAIGVLQ